MGNKLEVHRASFHSSDNNGRCPSYDEAGAIQATGVKASSPTACNRLGRSDGSSCGDTNANFSLVLIDSLHEIP